MLIAYRVVYIVIAGLILGNFVTTHYYGDVPRSTPWLILACKLSVVSVIGAAAFYKTNAAVIWGIVLVWEGLFVWYSWFSPGAPFLLYRSHTWTTVLFVGLFLWFISLPVVRRGRMASQWARREGRIPSR